MSGSEAAKCNPRSEYSLVNPVGLERILSTPPTEGRHAIGQVGDWLTIVEDFGHPPKEGEAHLDKTDVFIIFQGEADFTVGGQLIEPEKAFKADGSPDSNELRSRAIAGGERVIVAAGSILRIPPGVAHTHTNLTDEAVRMGVIKVPELHENGEKISMYKPKGLIVPVVTPAILLEGGKTVVDSESLGRLVEHIIEGIGVSDGGLFILGTLGESREMNLDQKRQVIETVSRVNQGRLPLLVGVSANTIQESARLAEMAKEYGADAVVLVPYYGEGDPHEKVAAISRVSLPFILYNNPPIHTGGWSNQDLPIEFINEVAQACPSLVGIKESSKNPGRVEELSQTLGGINILHGSPTMAVKGWGHAVGAVFGFGNVYPHATVTSIDRILKNPQDPEALANIAQLRQGLGTVMEIKTELYAQGIIASDAVFEHSK